MRRWGAEFLGPGARSQAGLPLFLAFASGGLGSYFALVWLTAYGSISIISSALWYNVPDSTIITGSGASQCYMAPYH